MRKHTTIIIFVAALLLAVFTLSFVGGKLIREVTQEVHITSATTSRAVLARESPVFTLPDAEEKMVKSSDYDGAPLVLLFWSSWNAAAVDQLVILDAITDLPEGVRMLTVNSQEERSLVKNLLSRSGYSIPVLLDEEGSVGEQYGVRNLPTTYFIDREGVIRDIHVGVMSEEMLRERIESILR